MHMAQQKIPELPDELPWHMADLAMWGDSILTGQERWVRFWEFKEEFVSPQNPDGIVYEVKDPEGKPIYKGVDPKELDQVVRTAIRARYPHIFGQPAPDEDQINCQV